MCGIAAIFDPKGRAAGISYHHLIQKMCDVMAHRGPDHFSLTEDPFVSLGHRRLSVIDLSDQANQPMVRGDFSLIFNGEIYNYVEVREELKKRGAAFTTQSDTEVILEAYRIWGPECVRKFNGMFAFVLWDASKKRLFVARDRLGVKPLFVQKKSGRYYFASDLKSLWEVTPPSDRLNEDVLRNFFSQSFISVPSISTGEEGARKFPPAEYWILGEGVEERHRYWDLNEVTKRPRRPFAEIVEESEVLLKDAIRLRLRSDVPLGCFLSGGVDSSLVSALTAQELGGSFHTYSIGFDQESFDESPFAYRVARRYGTQHHHKRLNAGCLEELPKIVWSYSELFGDASALPTYFVSQFAKETLTVVLTGDGGDEAFGGYVDPFAVYLSQIYRKVPSGIRKLLGILIPERRFQRFQKLSFQESEAIYEGFKSGGWTELRGMQFDFLRECLSQDSVDQLLYADIRERLCYDFLVKVDMATMAHSLEARSPFLDYRLMELGTSLDHSTRYRHLTRKAVLKKMAEKYLDHDLIYRRKMGFSIPQADWLRSAQWFSRISKIIRRPTSLHHFIKPDRIEYVLDEFGRGKTEHANRVWLLLWFQIWEGLFLSKIYQPGQKLSELG